MKQLLFTAATHPVRLTAVSPQVFFGTEIQCRGWEAAVDLAFVVVSHASLRIASGTSLQASQVEGGLHCSWGSWGDFFDPDANKGPYFWTLDARVVPLWSSHSQHGMPAGCF